MMSQDKLPHSAHYFGDQRDFLAGGGQAEEFELKWEEIL